MDRRRFLAAGSANVAALGVAVYARGATPSSDWQQWRGPSRLSQVQGEPWPSIAESSLKQAWRVELGPSYSTPIVLGDRVFVTETRDKKFEVASALSRETGEKIWEARWEGAMKVPFFAASNGSWIRCTPAADEQRLYVGGMRDIIAALDTQSGEVVWRLDCVKEFGSSVPAFGFVASPLIDGEHLYVQAGGGLLKLERSTGKVIWRKLADGGGMYGSAFSSPIIATVAGKRQLLVQTRQELVGVDLESGAKLWAQKIPAFRGMNILTPLPIGDLIFTSSYGGGSREVAVSSSGGSFQAEEVWKAKAEGYMSSPVLVDGHIYLHLRNRRLVCLDAASGEKRWTSRETFGKYWSMVANGDQILALDQEGELLLLSANTEEMEIVERRKISEAETWGHLAVAGRQLFVRELNAAAMYQWA